MKKKNLLTNSNLFILATPAAAVMIMTFILSRGNVGIAIGTGITSLVSGKAVGRRDTEVAVLIDRLDRIKNAEELIAKLPSLQADTQTLITRQNELKNSIKNNEKKLSDFQEQLHHTRGELSQKEGQLKVIREDITSLSKTKDELERRIALTNQQNPDLAVRERLYSETEQLRLEKSSLDVQVDSLKSQKATLETVKVELATKQSQLEQLRHQIETLKPKTQGLEKQATELELLRVTYDALSLEKNSFETRINQLRPEITGLEAQKQQILQAIQENETKYRQIEQQRQESHRLRLEIKQQQHEISNLEREARLVTGIIASSEEEKARLEQDNHKLEQRLKRLKGEIEEIENNAALALQALRKELWNKKDLPQANRQIDPTAKGEQQFISGFANHLIQQGLTFPQRVINAFHTSLKVQDISALVILAGISGTGKSELPQRYADYIGAQKLTLAVQPRWDSPQDLQGFYNYIEKKYKPTCSDPE